MTSKLAFVFPGQGSQTVGMLADLASETLVIDTFEQASTELGYDLWDLVQNDHQGQLSQTHITQPALLTASVALWRLWCQRGGQKPAFMAGHSLGEYSALVCAGSLPFIDAVSLVKSRGEYMQAAVPAGTGAMAAIIGLADDAIAAACEQVANGDVVAPVNYNSPGQVVIAGTAAAVERAMLACKEAGAKRALPLPVSVPSHCELMRPAAQQLAQKLATIKVTMPDIPIIQNVHAQVPQNATELVNNLVAQLHQPVRWTDCVQNMAQQGVEVMLECGPGKVLTGLSKRIDKTVAAAAINDSASVQSALDL
ncbi:MAG: ACP S-malonyltransferase [Gammaproteobacteria bacterium]|nr:ACP S-malonyltransferase [Gammaproteobacteria bacterium]MCP4879052.1 ACP S-malonyltransferase [Gammaproteobacteria bacterium]MDP6165366.1 ACP S-malonyltransferase [Gammaproteobacteria bacterium]